MLRYSRIFLFFLFKQKTAYEMRISDWSSDVCSSDLARSPDSGGASSTRVLFRLRSAPISDEGGQEHDQAEDHHEGVVVEESGLGAPQHAREQVDEAHAAVDEGAIDHFFVIAARQPAHQHAASGQALDPQVVHPVL